MNAILMSSVVLSVCLSTTNAVADADVPLSLMQLSPSPSVNSESSTGQTMKGTVMGITERGPHAVDAAHLLAIQTILHPAYKPAFLALENAELAQMEEKYHLTKTDLPVFIFVDSNGAEVGRIVAGPLTTVGRYVANNSAIIQ